MGSRNVSNFNYSDYSISFIADSGASDHMVNVNFMLSNYSKVNDFIRCANKSVNADLPVLGIGDIYARTNTSRPHAFKLSNVKYSPDVAENLLSLRKFVENGYTVLMTRNDLKIVDPISRHVLLVGKYEPPSWIVIIQLVDPNLLQSQDFVLGTSSKISENERRLLGMGGASAPSVNDSDRIGLDELNDEDDVPLSKLFAQPEDGSEDPKQVQPRISTEGIEFDKPKLVVIQTSESDIENLSLIHISEPTRPY